MNIKEAKSIFCLGIGGIGVSGLARIFLSMGKKVGSNDIKDSGNNDVVGDWDLVVYTAAVPKEDLDKIKIPKLSQGEAIGQLMQDKYGIGVTGTNGKSTTTALLGLMLDQAGLDPSVLVGSLLSAKNETEKFKANARFGSSQYVVAESDEYDRKMLLNQPKMIVLTNIALDHLDTYKNLEDIKSAFLEYVKSLPSDGILIYNADDHNTVDVCKHATCHKFTFGIHHYADLQALNVENQKFDLHLHDEKIGKFELHVPGLFNVSNALGAALAAIKLGVSTEVIAKVLKEYAGIWRRFEVVGKFEGKIVVSDYGHHPDGVSQTIEAARQFYPGKKVLVIFQPHHRNRTKELFDQFVESLVTVDEVIVPEIFDVAGREHGETISSQMLVDALKSKGVSATFAQDLDETEELVREKAKDFGVLLFMGAGDIDNVARKLVQ